MGTISSIYSSSIGKKLFVGITGLFLCIYLVVHVAGNLLLYNGDNGELFNAYAHALSSNIFIRVIEVVLVAAFLLHIVTGTIFWFKNRAARPQRYEVARPSENSSLTSRTMFLTGSIVFIFLVIHLRTFWLPVRFPAGGEHPSLYNLVIEAFSSPIYSGFYVVAMVLLAFHLRHGFQSVFQTFGFHNQRYAPLIKAGGVIFWLIIPLLFASMPIYFYFAS
jgi:succinate dehydrogenase / fumarate reductase cytochrome b subunit